MEIKGDAKLLRIFISSTDKYKHEPLYEVIVFTAKKTWNSWGYSAKRNYGVWLKQCHLFTNQLGNNRKGAACC